MYRWLLLAFLATIAIDWPQLAFNAQAADVIFITLALATAATPRAWLGLHWNRLDVAIIIYLAGSITAAVFSPEPRAGIAEIVRQFYLAAMYLVIVIAVRRGYAHTVATGLAVSGTLLAAIGLLTLIALTLLGWRIAAIGPLMTLPYIGETLRLRAMTTSEAMLACVLAVSLPFAMLHPWVRAEALRRWMVAAVIVIAAAWTFSHSVAGVAVAALIIAWPSLAHSMPARWAASIVTLAIVVGLNFAATLSITSLGRDAFRDDTVYHYAVDRGRANVAGVDIEYQTMSYFRLKQVALNAFMRRPLTGVGPDRFHTESEIAYQQGRLTAPYRAIDPHSTFIGRLAETGLVGAGSLLFLWIAIAWQARQLVDAFARPPWMVWAAAAALAGTLVNSLNADVMNFRFLWVVLGLLRGFAYEPHRPNSTLSGTSAVRSA